jgi:hypothetical protein
MTPLTYYLLSGVLLLAFTVFGFALGVWFERREREPVDWVWAWRFTAFAFIVWGAYFLLTPAPASAW